MQVCASCKDVARDNASFVPAAPRWLGLLLILQRPENAYVWLIFPWSLGVNQTVVARPKWNITDQMQFCASCKDVARDNASFVPLSFTWD